MRFNSRRTLADRYKVGVTDDGTGTDYRVLLPGGITHTATTGTEREVVAAALRWFLGLDDEEVRPAELEFLGRFDFTAQYRFTV